MNVAWNRHCFEHFLGQAGSFRVDMRGRHIVPIHRWQVVKELTFGKLRARSSVEFSVLPFETERHGTLSNVKPISAKKVGHIIE
jgi:hypothetical protein